MVKSARYSGFYNMIRAKNCPRRKGEITMALTRKMLKAMGIEEEKIDQIIEAHGESVEALKNQVSAYKADAEKLPGVQKELDEMKAAGDGGYREKYEKEHSDFEAYKTDIAAKETAAKKKTLYRALLAEAGVDAKRVDAVLKLTDFSGIELEGEKLKDAETLTSSVKEEWKDFIVETKRKGADVPNPPANGGSGKAQSVPTIF